MTTLFKEYVQVKQNKRYKGIFFSGKSKKKRSRNRKKNKQKITPLTRLCLLNPVIVSKYLCNTTQYWNSLNNLTTASTWVSCFWEAHWKLFFIYIYHKVERYDRLVNMKMQVISAKIVIKMRVVFVKSGH